MSHILEDLKKFLEASPTSWHATQEIGSRLATIDFTPLEEDEKWEVEPGKKYFVQRGGSLCAFSVPAKKPTKILMIGSHTDSPALKLKPNPEIVIEGETLLETEVYGSPLLSSWLNRDLGIAGRVSVQNGSQIEEQLVFFDETALFIPQLAIHLDREVNEKGVILNKQDHLRPILSLGAQEKNLIEKLLKTQVRHPILSFDLFLVPLESARYMGLNGEMLASYRLDNLSSAHACTAAIASAPITDSLQMALFWDHEEIGSKTAEGASSPFLLDTIRRIGYALGLTEEEIIRLKNHSLCISVDVAHAFNANFPQKYDPQHHPLAGGGVVLKYNADKKYASDSRTAAPVIAACKKLNLKLQNFVSRSDMPCGSTVGPIIAQSLGIPTVDIGIPIFSMHSSREVIACQDHLDMCQLLTHFLST
jgi:aspartyl aminopeptidase